MRKQSTNKPTPARLRDAFLRDLPEAWRRSRALHPDHTPYAFVLHGVEGGHPSLWPVVLTEESLTQVSERYVRNGEDDTVEDARKGLRYATADSPLLEELADGVPSVNAIFAPHAARLGDEAGYKLLAKAAMDALMQLDQQGLFGQGAARQRMLLVIDIIDCEEDWFTKSAKRLNPKEVFQRLEDQTRIEGEYMESSALAVDPDGVSLYSTGSRNLPQKKRSGEDDSVSELVAYDIKGARLARRWDFTFPMWGDSGEAVAWMANSESVLMLRTKYKADEATQWLMRFAAGRGNLLQHEKFDGEVGSLAVSPDGLRVALRVGGSLHVLDEQLRPITRFELSGTPHHIVCLKTGGILVAADEGIFQADVETRQVRQLASTRSFLLRLNDSENLLAVSRFFEEYGSGQAEQEFGVDVLRYPSMELERRIVVPGHQAVTATISPDGKLVAFAFCAIQKYRYSVAVFDVATGTEIARRRTDSIQDLAFLRDSRTLAMAVSGHTTTEPIDLWRLPVD